VSVALATKSWGTREILSYIRDVDLRLSRTTRTRKISNRTSEHKIVSAIDAVSLDTFIRRNTSSLARFMSWKCRCMPEGFRDLYGVVWTCAELINEDIAPAGILRTWQYDPSTYGVRFHGDVCEPTAIVDRLRAFCDQIEDLMRRGVGEPEELACALEWELLAGPLHPFYDGCGRVGRAAAFLMRSWMAVDIPKYGGREAYFRAARTGREGFLRYVRGCRKVRV
jgi:hypothetical protein